jgi:hypothetical protein
MGCYFELNGKITVRECSDVERICSELEEDCGGDLECQITYDELSKTRELSFSGGDHMSYGGVSEISKLLSDLSPYVVVPVILESSCDNEAGIVYVGDTDQFDIAFSARALRAISARLDELQPSDLEQLAILIKQRLA